MKMKVKVTSLFIVLFFAVIYFYSCTDKNDNITDSSINNPESLNKKSANVSMSTFATGLDNPRGLEFGPDGYLYVAEGGLGGDLTTTETQCLQVPGAGPYSGDFNARISKISPNGTRTTVIDGLPSSQTNPQLGSLVSGVADVAFVNGQLYGIEAGAGCSHGLEGTDNTIFRVNSNGTKTDIVNLSDYQKANPVANSEDEDFEPDGTWYSMISLRGDLYAVEPNHGEMVRVTTNGAISRVIDVSASQGHIVPTVVAFHGNFYIGNLNTFPVALGSSSIFKVTPSGQIKKDANGLTTVLGIAFDNKDRMYVLESIPTAGFPTVPPTPAKIVCILPNGQQQDIVTSGLILPSAMTMGPDGNLYVSNKGFGFGPGGGEIVKVTLN